MKTSLKNFTKVLLGVAILGASAGAAVHAQNQKKIEFTNKKITTRYWGNNSTTGKYELLTSPPDFTNNCKIDNSHKCVVQSDNTTLPASMPYSQATPANNVQPHPSSNEAFYQ